MSQPSQSPTPNYRQQLPQPLPQQPQLQQPPQAQSQPQPLPQSQIKPQEWHLNRKQLPQQMIPAPAQQLSYPPQQQFPPQSLQQQQPPRQSLMPSTSPSLIQQQLNHPQRVSPIPSTSPSLIVPRQQQQQQQQQQQPQPLISPVPSQPLQTSGPAPLPSPVPATSPNVPLPQSQPNIRKQSFGQRSLNMQNAAAGFGEGSLPPKKQAKFSAPEMKWADQDEVITSLDEINPMIPLDVVAYYLNSAGFNSSDPRAIKLVALAAENFVSEVAHSSKEFLRLGGNVKEAREGTLNTATLAKALENYGLNIIRPSSPVVPSKKDSKGKQNK